MSGEVSFWKSSTKRHLIFSPGSHSERAEEDGYFDKRNKLMKSLKGDNKKFEFGARKLTENISEERSMITQKLTTVFIMGRWNGVRDSNGATAIINKKVDYRKAFVCLRQS